MQVQRRGQVGYEDLMRELEVIEHSLMKEDREAAMNLMVLEARIRERFQQMDSRLWDRYYNIDIADNTDGLSTADLQAMIPRDIPVIKRHRPRALETVSMAAVLAVLTAAGVFGLASILQLVLTWAA